MYEPGYSSGGSNEAAPIGGGYSSQPCGYNQGYAQPAVQPQMQTQTGYTQSTQPQVVGQAQVVSNQTGTPVIIQSATNFNTVPVSLVCQFCKQPVTTTVETSCSCSACCLCCWTGFVVYACIQACRGKNICCKDAKHTCPNCNRQLGYYEAC